VRSRLFSEGCRCGRVCRGSRQERRNRRSEAVSNVRARNGRQAYNANSSADLPFSLGAHGGKDEKKDNNGHGRNSYPEFGLLSVWHDYEKLDNETDEQEEVEL
jgi:hypothetical protein